MNFVTGSLDRFWFKEAPAERLGILRILIGGFAIGHLIGLLPIFFSMPSRPKDLFEPTGIVTLLQAPIPSPWLYLLIGATLLSGIAFFFGWQFRFSGPLFGVLLLWSITYYNSWTMIFHSQNVMVLHVLILGLARSADAYSLDSRSFARFSSSSSWRYGWPIRLLCMVTVLTYFLSGVAKVAGPNGWEWANGELIRNWVAYDAMRKNLLGSWGSPLISLLFEELWFFHLISIFTLILELGAPLVLINPWFGYVWAVNAYAMHWGIFAIMTITFPYYLWGTIYASFFPVERLVSWGRSQFFKKVSHE